MQFFIIVRVKVQGKNTLKRLIDAILAYIKI